MKGLLSKFYFVIVMLILYRIGTYVPLPGINAVLLSEVVKSNTSGMLGMFNMLTGGALGRLSIFSLNIMPYITASIVMQLMSVISTNIANLKKEGEQGRKKINQYTRYLTIILALSQGYGIAVGAESIFYNKISVVTDPGITFRLIAALNLAGGTMFVVWITDQITTKGIGNGSSLVIFCGIVAGLPSSISNLFAMSKAGSISATFSVFMILVCIALVTLIVFMEKAQRKVTVHYPKKQIGRKMFGGESTHLPIKMNTSGVIGPIFANSILLFPTTILGFADGEFDVDSWQYFLMSHFSHGKSVYIILYALLIIFFTFFYTSIIFNTEETAENLRKSGAILVGRRPGPNTASYLDFVLSRITFVGSIYVAFICVIPEILIAKYSMPFYLGGTSLLIVVSVVIELFQQTQMYIINTHYGSLMKNNSFLMKY